MYNFKFASGGLGVMDVTRSGTMYTNDNNDFFTKITRRVRNVRGACDWRSYSTVVDDISFYTTMNTKKI